MSDSEAMGAWISALEGRPSPVTPLSSSLSGGQSVQLEIQPLFYRRPPEAHQEALDSEISQARSETIASLQDAHKVEHQEMAQRFASSVSKLEEAIAQVEHVVAAEVVDLALLVAQQLIGVEIQRDPEILITTVSEALAQFPHEGNVCIRLHPDDLELIRREMSEREDVSRVEWQEDLSISLGDCIVETPTRLIDASIESRLGAVRNSLVKLLMSEEEGAAEAGVEETP